MKLSGELELIIYYELPDSSKIDIKRLTKFSLGDNSEAIDELENSYSDDKYFDSSDYGCLEVEYKEIEKCFTKLGLIGHFCKILNKSEIINHLEKFERDVLLFKENKESYERDIKINMLINEK
jgi:hypothetical protein